MQTKNHGAIFCAPGEARTLNHQIRSLLLYPLSYGGVFGIIHEMVVCLARR